MALLAEHKRKTKFGLDPRNTSWSNDTSKFGQRLMEKMGWEKGKGLGANENGMTEHIKASYKSDTRGLGCTPQTADAWIAHQDDFNDLLKMLNSQSEAGNPEEKTTQKTNNVDGQKRYYGRFARGQVQKLRSTKDLDCIFGRRKSKTDSAESNEQSRTSSDCDDSREESRHGLTTVTSTSSVQEYFAKKMAEMKARKEVDTDHNLLNGSEISSRTVNDNVDCEHKTSQYSAVNFSYNDEVKKTSSSTNEQPSRGWYQNFTQDNLSNVNLVAEEKSSKKKKSKKRKKEKDTAQDDNCDIEIKKSSRQKNSKKQDKRTNLEDSLLSVSKDEDKKLSKKMKNKEREIKSTKDHLICVAECDKTSERKQKKNKKRLKNMDEDFIVDNKSNTIITAEVCRNNKKSYNDVANDVNTNVQSTEKQVSIKTEKIKRQREKQCDVADVYLECETRKKKKRKHSQTDADENSVSTEYVIDSSDRRERKSKKKRKRETDTHILDEDKAKEEIHEDNVTDDMINDTPQMLDRDSRNLKKKEKRKKKEMKKAERDIRSHKLFPGSNIADIVGYGIKQDGKRARKNKHLKTEDL